jgi:Spy/CpxP family protein refolding chaperone
MNRRLALLSILAALALPLAAAAQSGPGPGPGPGPGADQGMRRGRGREDGPPDPRRAKLALTIGLAEALELDDVQALKLRSVIDQFEQRRLPLQGQQRDAMKVLKASADADRTDAAAVDQALAKLLDAREKLQALDRELIGGITKDLPAQKKARAVLFLARFHERMREKAAAAGRHGPRGWAGSGVPGAGQARPSPRDGAPTP